MAGASRTGALLLLAAVGLTACGTAGADDPIALQRSAAPTATTVVPTTVAQPPPADTAPAITAAEPAPPPTTLPAPVPAEPPTTTTTRPFIPRVVVDTGFAPYAVAESVTLHHPAAAVERIGFHQSGHDGARQQDATAGAARPFVMESRDRGTGERTAADIVVQPDIELRSPVTGTVKRGGTYTLYCDHRDEYLVIEPDARPGWEVKLLHFEGLSVAAGQRVEAGVTVVGARARLLPFSSQVDDFTAVPAWPHVHIEMVDPSIPDRPSPGGGC